MLAASGAGSAETGIWPRHVAAVCAFIAADTQWRTVLSATPAGLRTLVVGLDYAGAAVSWSSAGLTLSPEDFIALRAIEAEAVKALNGG